MANFKILDGVRVALTDAEELELLEDKSRWEAEFPERARKERDLILSNDVDPIVSNTLRWNSMTEAKRTEWTNYRQALLDIEDLEGYPNYLEIIWPTKPE
jgi:hypothetical protein